MKTMDNNFKDNKKTSERRSAQAFKKFVDFMYEHPEMMEEFPQTIIFKDDAVTVKFSETKSKVKAM